MAGSEQGQPAVFIDRDGTLHRELEETLSEPEQIEPLPGAFEAVARLARAGYRIVIVTNQSAVARGRIEPDQLARVHAALRERLAAEGARVDLILHCPHHPSEGQAPYRRTCSCRKPEPGLLKQAIERLGLDPRRSWIVGDARRDLQAGDALGVRPILVATGKGARERERLDPTLAGRTLFAPDLAAAAELLLASDQGR